MWGILIYVGVLLDDPKKKEKEKSYQLRNPSHNYYNFYIFPRLLAGVNDICDNENNIIL